jgi:hypothetical protein
MAHHKRLIWQVASKNYYVPQNKKVEKHNFNFEQKFQKKAGYLW